MLGGMNGLAPKRIKTFAELVMLALLGGIMACFARACITSLLYAPSNSFNWGSSSVGDCEFDGEKFSLRTKVVNWPITEFSGCAIICNGTELDQGTCEGYDNYQGILMGVGVWHQNFGHRTTKTILNKKKQKSQKWISTHRLALNKTNIIS